MNKYNNWRKYTNISLTLPTAQKYIRRHGTPDYIRVDNILFTIDWYDEGGRVVYYGNKTKLKVLEIHTEDRYGDKGFSDAEVIISPMVCYRTDITYADEYIKG